MPCPSSFRMGLEPLSEAPLQRPAAAGASFPGGPRCGCGSSGILGSLHCSSLTIGTLPRPPALHFLLSAGCLLYLELSPSGWASASACDFSLRPVAAGALTVALTAAASLREFLPLSLVLPLRGPPPISRFVPQFEAQSESLTHSIPHSFLVESLSAYAVGLSFALWLCPERTIRFFFASVSFVDPVRNIAPLAPCLR